MARIAMWTVLVVAGWMTLAVAQDKPGPETGKAARVTAKAAQEKTVATRPWFDMKNCAMCKHLAAEAGLIDALHWEVYKIDNGAVMVTHVPPAMRDKMAKAQEAMHAAAQEQEAGDDAPLCGFCQCFGKLTHAGMQVQEFKGETGSIALLTSDQPEVVKQIHEMADRTTQEYKLLAEHKTKHETKSPK